MIPLQYDARVRGEQYQDLLRQAAQERLIMPVAALPLGRFLWRSFKWLDTQITRLRCAAFPSSTSLVCTP